MLRQDPDPGQAITDPRAQAAAVLGLIASVAQASGAAVVEVTPAGPQPFVHRSLTLAQVVELGEKALAAQRSGRPASVPGHAVAALRQGGLVVALLILEGEGTIERHLLELAERIILPAITRWREVSRAYVGSATLDEFRREKLLQTLELTGWNLARVAEELGASRNTVYQWIRRYRIPRRKMKRRNRRLTPGESGA